MWLESDAEKDQYITAHQSNQSNYLLALSPKQNDYATGPRLEILFH